MNTLVKVYNNACLRTYALLETTKSRFRTVKGDEAGASTVEYVLLCGVIVVAIITAGKAFQSETGGLIGKAFSAIKKFF